MAPSTPQQGLLTPNETLKNLKHLQVSKEQVQEPSHSIEQDSRNMADVIKAQEASVPSGEGHLQAKFKSFDHFKQA